MRGDFQGSHPPETSGSTMSFTIRMPFRAIARNMCLLLQMEPIQIPRDTPSARDVFQSRRVNCLQPGTAFMIANTASILHLRRDRGAISGCFENHVKVVQRVPVNIVFDLSQNPELYCSRESR